MSPKEIKSCAKQLVEVHGGNRRHDHPFHIYLCNVNINGFLIELLHRYIPNLFEKDFPMTVTSKSYLELFDKNKLVYLTPHCNAILDKYDPQATYIIGALVDKVITNKYSKLL